MTPERTNIIKGSVAMTYDQWKARELDDLYDDEPEEPCFHEDSEIAWDGLVTCNYCGKCWEASAQELDLDRERVKRHDAWCRREERKIRIKEMFGWMAFWRRWKRKPRPTEVDDGIPF